MLEARHHIALLNHHLALTDRNTADIIRLGEEINLSRWQLRRLDAAWRDLRDPKLIIVDRRGSNPMCSYGIAPRATEIANVVITCADADTSFSSTGSEVISEQ